MGHPNVSYLVYRLRCAQSLERCNPRVFGTQHSSLSCPVETSVFKDLHLARPSAAEADKNVKTVADISISIPEEESKSEGSSIDPRPPPPRQWQLMAVILVSLIRSGGA